MNMKVYYKCVNNDRLSSQAHRLPPPLVLKYEKNKIVTAPAGTVGIMMFNSRCSAERFLNQKIIKVEAIGKVSRPNYVLGIKYLKSIFSRKRRWWFREKAINGTDKNINHTHLQPIPWGTRCCQAVRVLS